MIGGLLLVVSNLHDTKCQVQGAHIATDPDGLANSLMFIDNEKTWPALPRFLDSPVATAAFYTALPLESTVLSLGAFIYHPMHQLSDGSLSLSPAILTSHFGILCLSRRLRPLSSALCPCLMVLDSY